ncbi:tetratricopeptide repeat protein [Lentzea pudingi]|uniref:tetratricopeptide repeat protein n=1 Tax=Lentzea pudingi TaxID=1789439 RepID=UPI0016692A6F|nr:tetratricopeptide repeat protein [Lentzea pudingi]
MTDVEPSKAVVPASPHALTKVDFVKSGTRLVAISGGAFAIKAGLDAFDVTILSKTTQSLILYCSLIANVFLIVELVLAFLRVQKAASSSTLDDTFPKLLVREITGLQVNRDYARIIRYREAFSRTLWLEGNLDERIQLGTLAEDAAIQLGNRSAQAAALIDDLGWTHVAKRDYATAERHIKHGKTVAIEEGDSYWQAKAERHLAGIAIGQENYNKAYDHLAEAAKIAGSISENLIRDEMLAGIEYGLAECAYRNNENAKALTHLDTSEVIRKQVGDATRAVRVRSLRGRILLKLDRAAEAKDAFRRGLREAREVGRRDEQIINLLGLARVTALEGREVQAAAYKREADELLADTPVPGVMNEFNS